MKSSIVLSRDGFRAVLAPRRASVLPPALRGIL